MSTISSLLQGTRQKPELSAGKYLENPTHLPDPNPPETASLQFGKYKVNLSEVRKYQVTTQVKNKDYVNK